MSERTVYLFTTPFCKLCPSVKKKLDSLEIEYEAVNAVLEAAITKSYNVRAVPHLVVEDESGVLYSQGGADNQDYNKIKEILSV